MSNPGWISRQARRQLDAPSISYEVADSFYTAPGWREIGMEYSLVPDVSYPPDPQVTHAIHSFDPGVIPLWVRWIFLSPQDTGNPEIVVFGRHAVGRYVKNLHGGIEPFSMDVPSNYHGPLPNIIERILQGRADPRATDLPGAYKPWDWSLFYELRSDYLEDIKTVKEMAIDAPRESWLRYKAWMAYENSIRQKAIRDYASRKLENVSEVEAKERFLGKREKEVKPFFDMGGN